MSFKSLLMGRNSLIERGLVVSSPVGLCHYHFGSTEVFGNLNKLTFCETSVSFLKTHIHEFRHFECLNGFQSRFKKENL